MGVVRVVIQRILPLRGVHPPVFRPRQSQEEHEGVAVGDGGDGSGRAWVLEVILQVIVRLGKGPPRRAWVFDVGPLEVFLWPILPGPLWAFTFDRDKRWGFKAEG